MTRDDGRFTRVVLRRLSTGGTPELAAPENAAMAAPGLESLREAEAALGSAATGELFEKIDRLLIPRWSTGRRAAGRRTTEWDMSRSNTLRWDDDILSDGSERWLRIACTVASSSTGERALWLAKDALRRSVELGKTGIAMDPSRHDVSILTDEGIKASGPQLDEAAFRGLEAQLEQIEMVVAEVRRALDLSEAAFRSGKAKAPGLREQARQAMGRSGTLLFPEVADVHMGDAAFVVRAAIVAVTEAAQQRSLAAAQETGIEALNVGIRRALMRVLVASCLLRATLGDGQRDCA